MTEKEVLGGLKDRESGMEMEGNDMADALGAATRSIRTWSLQSVAF
jgi:hypothetical protein